MHDFTIESHFVGKDRVVREIYDQLRKSVRQFGPITEEPKKTSIHVVNKTPFAGIATRKAHLILTIKSDKELASPRIHRTQQTSASRFHHEVKLVSRADVDEELVGWLKAALQTERMIRLLANRTLQVLYFAIGPFDALAQSQNVPENSKS